MATLNARQQKLLDEIRAVQRELTGYRDAQLQFNPSTAEGRSARQAIRARLDTINAGLDTNLLKIGQIQTEADGSYNTQPFHWFTAFYEILDAGGFDVIVGNPPYVEYSKVKGDRKKDGEDRYKIYGYKTESAGNLYAFVMERCLSMLGSNSYCGVIIPLSTLCTQRMNPVLRLLMTKASRLWTIHFGWRPAKLFEGVNLRLSVVLGKYKADEKLQIYTTKYNKWNTEFRSSLFQCLRYIIAEQSLIDKGVVPKISEHIEHSLIKKMLRQSETIEKLTAKSSSFLAYYKNTGVNHWITSTNFPPQAFRGDEASQSSRQTTIILRGQLELDFVICCLNSNLVFWYYTVRTNCRDLNPSDIKEFPIPAGIATDSRFMQLSQSLMESLDEHSEYIVRDQKLTGSIRLQSFRPQPSKPIIDEIDRVLASHYGFTEEELDFIINYDIKYRMGRDADSGDEE